LAEPRGLLLAAPRSGSGKTVVTLGLLAALKARGLAVAPAKTGPDYIDTAILERTAGRPAVNLDPFSPEPSVDGKGTHGGYCGPAVKPIAMNMVAEIARDAETHGLPISGIGGITTWRDAAEFMALGAGNVQVCTAAMVYGFKIVREMISGLSDWMDAKGHKSLDDIVGRAVPNVTDWQYLNLNYVAKAQINQDLCIKCGRCHIACEDTSHQAITALVNGARHFEVIEEECVGCNLCVNVCPVENCITMEPLAAGVIDERTGMPVSPAYANWTQHPNNPMAKVAAE
jgi:dihydropyrimidine dehydrogenase (NAD+) subunit PreA